MAISRITGMTYCANTQSKTWHNNIRYKQACRLASMFNFSLCSPDTEHNLNCAVEQLRHMYQDLKIGNSQLVEKFGWPNKFFTSFLEGLGIKRMTKKEGLKNYARISGKAITDGKRAYWAACRFKFDLYSEPAIPNFHLFEQHGIYRVKTNPNGMTRDHMYSVYDGWNNQVDPALIAHPANCCIMSHRDNSTKNNGSTISLDDLKQRVQSWTGSDQLAINTTISKRKGVPTRNDTKQKLRNINKGKKFYTNGHSRVCVKTHELVPDGFYKVTKTTRLTRIFHRPSKWDHVDWPKVQNDIQNGVKISKIKRDYAITKDALHWAKNSGLITSWYVCISHKDKFPWTDIATELANGSKLVDVCAKFNVTKHQILYAKKQNLL